MPTATKNIFIVNFRSAVELKGSFQSCSSSSFPSQSQARKSLPPLSFIQAYKSSFSRKEDGQKGDGIGRRRQG